MNTQNSSSTRRRILGAAFLCLVCSAGTPGDIGGCGQPVEDLDAPAFFDAKKSIDCESCRECDLSTETCDVACNGKRSSERRFSEGCFPLVHDGAVCLRALIESGCDDYTRFVSDDAPETPSECNFCPPELSP